LRNPHSPPCFVLLSTYCPPTFRACSAGESRAAGRQIYLYLTFTLPYKFRCVITSTPSSLRDAPVHFVASTAPALIIDIFPSLAHQLPNLLLLPGRARSSRRSSDETTIIPRDEVGSPSRVLDCFDARFSLWISCAPLPLTPQAVSGVTQHLRARLGFGGPLFESSPPLIITTPVRLTVHTPSPTINPVLTVTFRPSFGKLRGRDSATGIAPPPPDPI